MSRVVHTCSCGATYTLEEWHTLELSGVVTFGDGADPPATEMRHCHCGSTRAIEIDRVGNPWQGKPSLI